MPRRCRNSWDADSLAVLGHAAADIRTTSWIWYPSSFNSNGWPVALASVHDNSDNCFWYVSIDSFGFHAKEPCWCKLPIQNLRFNSVISWAASFLCNIFIKWYNMLVSEFKRSDRAAISGNPTFGELKAVDSDDGEPASCKTASCLNNSLNLWKVHAIIVPASTL